MRLLSVDPGTRQLGVALWHGDVLERALLVRWPLVEDLGVVDALVEEIPQCYPQWRQKGDPNDLIRLALVAGELVGALRAVNPGIQVTYLRPSEWKAQAKKTATTERVKEALTGAELARIERPKRASSEEPRAAMTNIYDAIGIGLVHLGRKRKGVV